jgi:hypothetical protein
MVVQQKAALHERGYLPREGAAVQLALTEGAVRAAQVRHATKKGPQLVKAGELRVSNQASMEEVDRPRTWAAAVAVVHLRMSTRRARSIRSMAGPMVPANRDAMEPLVELKSPPRKRHPWAAEEEAVRAKSSAELAAAPLCSPVAKAANLAAEGAVALRPLPMERERAPQGKTSSKVDHRRRRDPIRPCHS